MATQSPTPENGAVSDARQEKAKLILELRDHGVIQKEVLQVLEKVPREFFVETPFRDRAYENIALPIQRGQTISQPYIVGLMTQELKLTPRCKILEVGTGSGYQAAVLSHLCRRIYTVERYRSLFLAANSRFEGLGLHNIVTRFGDGMQGWSEQAPFDRIIVTAAAENMPEALLSQLKVGGHMLIPLGPLAEQQLCRITRTETGHRRQALIPVRFVPLLEGLVPNG